MSAPADLLAIGAGPAGLTAALAYKRRNPAARVVVADRMDGPGAKLAVTGGGRGNLSRDIHLDDLVRAFAPSDRFVAPAIRAFPPTALRAFFRGIGVPTVVEPGGGIYPASQSAPAVRDALAAAARRAGVEFRMGAAVCRLEPPDSIDSIETTDSIDSSSWRAYSASSPSPLAARRVLLAAGGQSAPALGSDGSGFALARALGHRIVAPVPGLAPILVDDAPWISALAGVSLPDAALRLAMPQRLLRESRGPLLFTHRGLSGPAALDISAALSRALAHDDPFSLYLAVLPAPRDKIRALLDTLRRTDGARPLRRALAPPLPQRLADAMLSLAGVPPDTPAARLSAPAADRLASALCALPLTITRTATFAESMVTSGGVSLPEVHPKTLASRLHPTLSFAGEILDVAGPTGGYNLHWAFASALLAATATARS